MANEGMLGKTTIGGEKWEREDHPVIRHALPLDSSVTQKLPAGLVMERMASGLWRPYSVAGGGVPRAVVNEPCDPAHENSAKCVVHGCGKLTLLQVGANPADAATIDALFDRHIYAV
jgi:hypothetical protein